MKSNSARSTFHVDGQGVKVGVILDSYNTLAGNPAATDVANDDLPGNGSTPVDVVQEYPYGTKSDEGRAMLQIVHDIAPKANLAFRTGFISAGDFAEGIKDLKQAGCDVIVDDVTYVTEPFFKDGAVAKAVDLVKSQGVSYFSAAGNFGSKSYEGIFKPVAAPSGYGATVKAHDFSNGANPSTGIYQSVTLPTGDYTVVLQWEDSIYSLGQLPGALNDLDIT